jgi:hypothetical protein
VRKKSTLDADPRADKSEARVAQTAQVQDNDIPFDA